MRVAAKWSVRGFFVLLVALWVAAISQQWWVRWHAERLLGEIRSIEVGRTSEAQVRPLLDKWRSASDSAPYCDDRGCQYGTDSSTFLPRFLIGYPDERVINWLPRLVDHLGVRWSHVSAGVTVKDGVVTGRYFSEDVMLPVRAWFDRGGAWVPDMMVSSEETMKMVRYDGEFVASHRAVRPVRGDYGIIITFDLNDAAAEKDGLLAFRLRCITQLSPCLDESELLPVSQPLMRKRMKMVQQDNAEMIQSANSSASRE